MPAKFITKSAPVAVSSRRTSSSSADPVELAQKGQPEKAEQLFRDQIQKAPTDAVAHHNFAVFLSEKKRPKEAITHYQEALRHRPNYPEALRNFAVLLTSERQFNEAVVHLWAAVRLRPDDVQAIGTLGEALIGAKRRDEAIPLLRHAIRLVPTESTLHNQLGLAFFDAGRLEEGEKAFLNALQLDPKYVSAHNNLGSLYKAMGRSGEAFSCFEIALALDPDSTRTKWNRALTLLSEGDFERGWEEYEWRWHRPETPAKQLPKPVWNGESLEGKRIFVHAEQGLGDTLQFVRYINLLKEAGAYVIFEGQSPLSGVLTNMPCIDKLIVEGQPIPPFDVHCALLGLPRVFKTTQKTVPSAAPYLAADPDRVAQWRSKLDQEIKLGNLRVGISWQGNPHHQWDHFRSLPLTYFEPLSKVPGIELISLQRGPGIEQIENFQKLTGDKLVVPTDGQQTSPEHLADAAAIIAGLDLVISVDTATAHLSGALGKKVWVALSTIADWRWMTDRSDSPWYPTMRLFRQRKFGDWEGLVKRIAEHLAEFRQAAPQ